MFLHCEPQELLGAVKLRLALILAIDELDIRLYEFMSPERRAHVMALLADKVREAAKLVKKKPGQPKPDVEAEIRMLEIPPLPDDKKLWELGLENDAIVFFVYRTHPSQWTRQVRERARHGARVRLSAVALDSPRTALIRIALCALLVSL